MPSRSALSRCDKVPSGQNRAGQQVLDQLTETQRLIALDAVSRIGDNRVANVGLQRTKLLDVLI
jgi:hypothetical protein